MQEVTFETLFDKVKTEITDEENLNLIKKAYEYASSKHEGVKRLTGEDYINHPLNVAYIITNNDFDASTICAALLHDVMEDCDVTYDELKNEFGDEVARLVDGVTKINKINFDTKDKADVANKRKILVALCEDVRVIIIKLADRLHNMRTLWIHPREKQKEKAQETLDILTPISHRLGMSKITSELEDLCLRYLKPETYFSIVEKLNESKAVRDQVINEMMDRIINLLKENGINAEIKGRSKSIYSIYKKLAKGRKWNDIYDFLALRVFVNTEQECYQALGIIHSKYRPIPKRVKDYIASPKTNMYQSLHTTVFGIDGHLFEIQIRTYEMDEVAERGIAAHFAYKESATGQGKAEFKNQMEQKLQVFRNILELNNEAQTDEEFVHNVTEDLFKDTIYVFTPKGDVLELSKGSTPIDFAYKVHSQVGDKMVGATVNGSIVPLDYKLKDNDIVSIRTNQNSPGPSREWLQLCNTAQAKNKIKAFFNRIDKDEYLKNGEEILKEELKRRKIALSDFYKDDVIGKALEEYKYNNIEELYVNIGNGKLNPGVVINIAMEENTTKEELILKRTQNNNQEINTSIKNEIIVNGVDEIKANVASCCKPIPGDPVIGYITKGSGITVHRTICPNVKDLEERLINVRWNENITKKYPSEIIVYALKQDDILIKIISKTSNSETIIQKVNTIYENDGMNIELTVLTPNIEQLNKLLNDIRSIKEVTNVERVIR